MLSPHSHEENRGAGGVGIVFFHLLGWKWSAKFRSKGRWLTGIENWGSRGKSNNLCDWFCGYFISACEEQWGLTLSKSVMGPEGAGAMWLEELGQGSKEKEKEKSWLLLEALASSLSKAWWQEMGDIANKGRCACNCRQPLQWQEEPSHQQHRGHSPGSHRDRARQYRHHQKEMPVSFLGVVQTHSILQVPVEIVFLQWCYSSVRHAHGLWKRGNLSRQVMLICTLCPLDGNQIFMNPLMFGMQ